MKPPLSLLTVALTAALVSGCTADPSDDAATDDPPAAGTVAETVRYAAPGSPTVATNDPHGLLPGESDLVRMALTYDPLTMPGADGQTKPRLATSWEADETLTRWTVSIREGVTFSDGSPVRAADALYSLRRMGEKAAENFGRLRMFDLTASSAPDDQTLLLVTSAPYAEVGQALEGATFVVPDGSTDFTGDPVAGSGPFIPAGGDAQTSVFERNEDWWGPQPPAQRIEVRAIPDPQARADALLSGEVDLAGAVPATAAVSLDEDAAQLVTHPGATMYPLVMRMDTAPFDDPLVRQAVRMGLDRQQLLDTVFLGYGQLGNDLITPGDASSPTDLDQRTRDVARARELMTQAGLADGVDVTLHSTTAYPGMDTAATLIAEQLADIGVRVQVELSPPDSYFVDVYAQKPFYLSYLGGIPFLDVVRVALTPGSPTNETAWNDPTWSADLAAALAEPAVDTRAEQLADLQTRLRDEGGYAVWAVSDRLDLAAPGLTGLPEGTGFSLGFIDQVQLVD
ncbi:MAG: ABC transporter substrate-binding protein [Actinomycetota bacterium]|nr:ABC transporter substrate-binding protein [Actinomycetota bacterium]